MNRKDLHVIQNSSLFAGMTEKELQEALTALHARRREYSKDELLLMAGDLTDDFGMVLSGSVTIESNDVWGNRTIITHVSPGDYYAEAFSILPGEPAYVDVRANEATAALLFDLSGLDRLKNESHSWLTGFLSNLLTISIHKNMLLAERSFHTAPKTARGRVCAYLNGIALKKHAAEFDIPFDRQHMADYLNLDRSALSKELSRMRDDGLISFHKNHFRILQGDQLDSTI